MEQMIVTDNYGQVSEQTWKTLKERRITPAEWDELMAEGMTHDQAVRLIEKNIRNGAYDSYSALRAYDAARADGRSVLDEREGESSIED